MSRYSQNLVSFALFAFCIIYSYARPEGSVEVHEHAMDSMNMSWGAGHPSWNMSGMPGGHPNWNMSGMPGEHGEHEMDRMGGMGEMMKMPGMEKVVKFFHTNPFFKLLNSSELEEFLVIKLNTSLTKGQISSSVVQYLKDVVGGDAANQYAILVANVSHWKNESIQKILDHCNTTEAKNLVQRVQGIMDEQGYNYTAACHNVIDAVNGSSKEIQMEIRDAAREAGFGNPMGGNGMEMPGMEGEDHESMMVHGEGPDDHHMEGGEHEHMNMSMSDHGMNVSGSATGHVGNERMSVAGGASVGMKGPGGMSPPGGMGGMSPPGGMARMAPPAGGMGGMPPPPGEMPGMMGGDVCAKISGMMDHVGQMLQMHLHHGVGMNATASASS